jgi:ATP-binding cassette subfamily B protein
MPAVFQDAPAALDRIVPTVVWRVTVPNHANFRGASRPITALGSGSENRLERSGMARKKFPSYRQLDRMDCGPTCLKMIAEHYGKIYSRDYLREKSNITKEGVSFGGIAEAAENIGFESLAVNVNFDTLKEEVPLRCIAYWRQRHFIVIYAIKREIVYVADPAFGLTSYTKEELLRGWLNSKTPKADDEGLLLLLEPMPDFYEREDNTPPKSKLGFRFLLPYFRPYRKIIVQIFLGLCMGSLIQLMFPFLTQAIVDKGINYQNINFVYLMLIAELVLFFSQTSVQFIRSWLLLYMTGRLNIQIISDFLIKLMKLPIGFFDSKNLGDIIQRIDDHRRVQQFLSNSTLDVLFSTINIIIFGAVLLHYNLRLFMVFLIGSAIYVSWVLMFMKKRAELEYKRFDEAAGNQSSRVQLINGMQEIKLNNSERRRRWEWEAIQIRLFKISTRSLAVAQYQNMGGAFIDQVKNILITSYSAKLVIDGDITLGMMLAVQYILGQLNMPINNFLSFIQNAQDAKISLERLGEIHDKENEDEGGDHLKVLPEDKTIRIENLGFRYGGRSSPLVLHNIDLTIPAGKVTAIVGPSGSGKTTLVKLLLKFYEASEGRIFVGNTDLKNIDAAVWRNTCGAVMQDGFIFADSIARNITESNSEGIIDKLRLRQATCMANIDDYIESLPTGYNTRIGASGISLSGGQRQRILIARAVYKNPELLFFDEATSALDANNERKIMENMERFYEGRTVVVVAHRLSTVKNADQIIVLEKGQLIEQGTHEELIRARGAYFTLVKNQLELGD